METYTDIANFNLDPTKDGSAVMIGNFDGLHVGHQSLVRKTKDFAAENNLQTILLSFTPAPEQFFRGDLENSRLFSNELKVAASCEAGLDACVIQTFNQDFSRRSHTQFFDDALCDSLKAKCIVVGNDFRFGHKRKGDVRYLADRCKEDGLHLIVGESIEVDQFVVSSSMIRSLVSSGKVGQARKFLGRPYLLQGSVIKGEQLGRKLGFPTANIDTNQLLPKTGVYACFAEIGGTPTFFVHDVNKKGGCPPQVIPAVVNIGFRPTVSGEKLTIEAHLMGENVPEEFYGEKLSLYLIEKLRDEKKFAGLEELKAAISADIQQANKLLAKS